MTHPIPITQQPDNPITETLYPDQDISDGNWVNRDDFADSVLNPLIDESTPFDSTAISTESGAGGRFIAVCGTPGNEQLCTLGLPDFATKPSGSETYTLSIRARLKETVGTGHTGEVELEILKGTTLVNSSNPIHSLTTSFAQYDEVLTITERNSLLLDTSDMRLRVRARACVAGTGDEADVEVSMIRLNVVP